ncbi:MAG: hypothetical protein GIX00_08880 [Candidatus Eremiobacteraeota bacterium]|nr:hypothetical protein [Candidatus Eremiobacteraeota bacterium]MBC5808699.1 hypothetical protein [Candidatus Eremiobacteraeota bacterium]
MSRHLALRQIRGRAGEEHLTAVTDGQQAGDAVDAWAEIVAVAFVCKTDVDGHAYV